MLRAFFLFTISAVTWDAAAFNCMHRGLQEHAKQLATNVSWVEEPGEKGRRTTKQYAADHSTPDLKVTEEEIIDKFAATGLLECPGYKGTAQLSGDNSTISTSAHSFTDSETCLPRRGGPKTCTFTVTTSRGVHTEDVSELVGQGFKCPRIPNMSDDWAVLKLKNPIPHVKPYSLPAKNERLGPGDKLISVNARNNDFFTIDKTTKEKIYPKTIEDCAHKVNHYDPIAILYNETTCDLGAGASGGSILKGDNVLVAIHKSNDDTKADNEAGKNGKSVRKPHSEGTWASYHVLLKGDFLETLKRATGQLN